LPVPVDSTLCLNFIAFSLMYYFRICFFWIR
jgi:hypothetical protein